MSKRSTPWRSLSIALAALLAATPAVHGDHVFWTGSGADNNFSTGANWEFGSPPASPNSPAFAGFTGEDTMNMDVAATVSNLYLENGADVLISGSETLTIEGTIFVTDGFAHTIDAPIRAGNGSLASQIMNGDLLIGGDLDLGTNSADFLAEISSDSSMQVNGVISGAGGSVTKNGAGSLTLNGANSYDGGTTLNGGTLGVGHDDALGVGGLTVTGDATLTSVGGSRVIDNDVAIGTGNTLAVAGENDLSFSGVLSGDGDLTKNGSGTFTLADDTGASSGYMGTIALNSGGLVLNREVGGDLSVAGGSLMGAGTIGGNLVASSGTISPGNSIGTMNVAGDFTLGADATLSIEIDPAGQADLVDATGSATLADGSTIDVSLNSGVAADLTDGDAWTIITTGTGVSDEGAMFQSNVTGYAFFGEIVGNDYRLIADEITLQKAVSGTRRKAIAAALDADAAGDAGLETLRSTLLGQPLVDTHAYIDATTPEPVDAVFAGAGLRVNQAFHGTLNNYLRARRHGMPELARSSTDGKGGMGIEMASAAAEDPATLALFIAQTDQAADADGSAEAEGQGSTDGEAAPLAGSPPRPRIGPSPWGGFATAYGVFDRRDSDANTLGADTDTVAGQFGVDYQLDENWLVGMSFTYARSDVEFHNDRGESDVDTLRVGPYLSYQRGNWFANASATYGYHHNDLTRRAGGDSFTADYDAHDFALYGGLGHAFNLGDHWSLTPEASLQYIYYDAGGYTESGGVGALVVESSDFDSLRSALGVTLSRRFELGGATLIPDVHVGWAHEFLNDGDSLNARFVNGSTPFSVQTTGTDSDSVFYGVGVTALLNPDTSLGLHYEGETFDSEQVHAVVARLRFNF